MFEINGSMVVDMLAAFEAALIPGVRERDLLATLSDTMLRAGGEYLATSTVCSGPNTNPWRSEATDRVVEPGDLVFVDTDTVGIEGMFFCVSRTFLAGRRTPDPRATRHVSGVARVARGRRRPSSGPGLTCAEIADEAPALPEKYLPQRYECMIHGIGLEEESPSVCYPLDRQSNGERVIQEDMALVIELYAGEVGGDHGVKLGDEVLVTPDGVRVLAPYPFSSVFA